jgi:hypothetical protein
LNNRSATIAHAAYLDLRLPADAGLSDWYPVNLPFDAAIADIRDAADTTKQFLHLQDFGIAAFDTHRRAMYGIGNQPSNPYNDWQFLTEPTMSGGTGYMVTAHATAATHATAPHTLRFKAANLNLFSTVTVPITYSVGPTDNFHHGINYLAQPLPINALIEGGIPAGAIIQVSESLSSDRIGAASYVAKIVGPSLVIAPDTNYFYQTNSNAVVSYAPTTNTATVRSYNQSRHCEERSDEAIQRNSGNSGKTGLLHYVRNDEGDWIASPYQVRNDDLVISRHCEVRSNPEKAPMYYELRLYDDMPDNYDALFVATSEDALKDRYEIGRDVIKMGAVGHAMQIWSEDFGVALCANEVRSENDMASIPLFIHTPEAGKTYHLKLQNSVKDSEQLLLYRNGKQIQNLTESPQFTFEGTGNTIDEYSLRISNGTTDNNPVVTGDVFVYSENNTIIIRGLQVNDNYFVYDLSGRLYANGKAKDNLTKIQTPTGVYVVHVNGNSYKVIVK